MHRLRQLSRRRLPGDPRHPARQGEEGFRARGRSRLRAHRILGVHRLRPLPATLRAGRHPALHPGLADHPGQGRLRGMSTITNLLVVGIGGQGVMTATEILAEAAIALGHDAKKTEVAGMAQRGGVVSSHLRFGPKVLSPQIAPGTADVLLAVEAAEGLRWQHMLKPGSITLTNTAKLVPPVVELGLYDYPADPLEEIRQSGNKVVAFDATSLA